MANSDILLTPVRVFYAAVGTALPDENTVGFGEEWTAPWKECGYTNIPLSMSYAIEKYEVIPEQVVTAVKTLKTKETLTLETSLIEITGDNLKLAFPAATVTPTAADATHMGKTEVKGGGSPSVDTYAWGFEGEYKDDDNNSLPVRFLLYKGQAILNGQLQFAKSKEVGIPLQITGLADTTKSAGEQLFQWVICTAPKTA
jgi:hypothetical protein